MPRSAALVIGSSTFFAPLSRHTCKLLASSSTFRIVPLILISPSTASVLTVGRPRAILQCRQCHLSGHANVLQILIVDDVIPHRGADASTDSISVSFQEIERRIRGFLAVTVAAKASTFKFSVAGQHLAFKAEYADHTGLALTYGIYLSRIADAIGDELSTALLRHGNKFFFKDIKVDIAEVHIIELHSTRLFQLFLDTTAHFRRKYKNFFNLFLREFSIRIQQFHIVAHNLADSNCIAPVQVFPKA